MTRTGILQSISASIEAVCRKTLQDGKPSFKGTSTSPLFELARVLVRLDHVAVDLHLPQRWLSLLIRRCEVVSKAIYFVRQLLF
jgi:hypothetical protein